MASQKPKNPVAKRDSAMSAAGLEPATNGLKGHCSTIELRARLRRILSCPLGGVNGIAINISKSSLGARGQLNIRILSK